ncbi:MAG: RluA family pseudouridine synthase [Synechococcales cyanobacterium CRU_2_2]|nr:RluA family pseudouridine synthase [Synechococcales cyanobacterium CRU_2_2]
MGRLNLGWIYRDRLRPPAAGLTLLAYYTQTYPHSSEAEWRSRIESGQILIDGQVSVADARLQSGQTLTYHRPPWQEPEVPLSFEILHEDADLLIVHKPSGLPVMPGGGFLENTLLWQLKRLYPQETPVPIHRLGRGTSGLVLLGRSPLAKSELTRQMRERQITKIYRAIAGGTDLPEQFEIKTPIGKLAHPILGYVFAASSSGKFAHSSVRVLRKDVDTTLVEVEIFTGRPHQIRIHLAAAGYPLWGDPLYLVGGLPRRSPDGTGRWPTPGDCGYFLHAFRLAFTHPRTAQPFSIESESAPNLRL